MFDTHCHVQFKAFDHDRDNVIKKCLKKGMILNIVGTQAGTSQKAVEIARQYKNVYATVGLHPIQHEKVEVKEEATSFKSRAEEFIDSYYEDLLKHSKVIAIGETGLDKYHIPKSLNVNKVLKKQSELFEKHAKLALKHKLPLVIHVRDAHMEMVGLLKRLKKKLGTLPNGVIHCYSGSWQQANEYLNLGFYLGFTGTVTFEPKKTDPKPQDDLVEVVKKMPQNRILVETDSPYLAPQKYRGKRSEPWMVSEVLKSIAKYRDEDVKKIFKTVLLNSKKLFNIK